MKNSVIDVLMYLFDNFMDNPIEVQAEIAVDELEQAGFEPKDIDKAFGWLEQLLSCTEDSSEHSNVENQGQRIFTRDELQRLSPECLDFLMYLEKNHIISCAIRELVLEQILALDARILSLLQFKRIILMVLMNIPESDDAIIWLESFIQDEVDPICH